MTRATPLWVQPASTEMTISNGTAFKVGFYGAFGALFAGLLISAVGWILFVVFVVLLLGSMHR